MSRRLVWLLVALGLVALAGGGYLGLVAPRHDAVVDTTADVAAARAQLVENRALAARAEQAAKLRTTDLFQLERALPDRLALQNVLLQLTDLAQDSGVQILSVAPRTPTAGSGFERTPIDVTLNGTYASVSDFLAAARQLVRVRDGRVHATGPLFTIEHVGLATRAPGLPALQADVTLSAYAFDGGGAAAAGPVPQPATDASPAPTDAVTS